MSKIQPINGHLLIQPIKQESAFSSSQQQFEERGQVLAISPSWKWFRKITVGMFVFFDSWKAAKYMDGEGNEHWVVPQDAIRAVEI